VSQSVDPARRLAALGDLRTCLDIAAEIGELEVIEGADPHLEMGALYELSLRKAVPPILLFRKIKGFPDDHRIVCNVRSSRVLNDGAGLELVQNYRKHRRKASAPIASEYVDAGPVLVPEPCLICTAAPSRTRRDRTRSGGATPSMLK
jgi:hypothetical protein